jgi:DNA polymerase V
LLNNLVAMMCQSIPYLGTVQAGFPSPASDYAEEEIDLNRELIERPAATFYVRAVNDSMIEAHIPPGALLVVDKSLRPKNYSIVIASVDSEFLVKYYVKDKGRHTLVPANGKYKTLIIAEDMDFRIWGVVTAVVIQVSKYPV